MTEDRNTLLKMNSFAMCQKEPTGKYNLKIPFTIATQNIK